MAMDRPMTVAESASATPLVKATGSGRPGVGCDLRKNLEQAGDRAGQAKQRRGGINDVEVGNAALHAVDFEAGESLDRIVAVIIPFGKLNDAGQRRMAPAGHGLARHDGIDQVIRHDGVSAQRDGALANDEQGDRETDPERVDEKARASKYVC